jgi:4-hydroxy-tetrahydrodipicolinate reductase
MKLGIAGYLGKMGQFLLEEAQIDPGIAHIFGSSRSIAQGKTPIQQETFTACLIEDLFQQCDCVIDFTHPSALAQHCELAKLYKVPLVIGTTGLSKADHGLLHQTSHDLPILYGTNMSLAVAVLKAVTRKLSQILPLDYDIEIQETHHRFKQDAPSGTAISLGQAAALGRGWVFEEVACFERSGQIGPKPQNQIGFATSRSGGVIGDHHVVFASEQDRLVLSHLSASRAIYAKSAIRAAKWLVAQAPRLYSIEDVLGLTL